MYQYSPRRYILTILLALAMAFCGTGNERSRALDVRGRKTHRGRQPPVSAGSRSCNYTKDGLQAGGWVGSQSSITSLQRHNSSFCCWWCLFLFVCFFVVAFFVVFLRDSVVGACDSLMCWSTIHVALPLLLRCQQA